MRLHAIRRAHYSCGLSEMRPCSPEIPHTRTESVAGQDKKFGMCREGARPVIPKELLKALHDKMRAFRSFTFGDLKDVHQ
ncbi:hypothetical protein [Ferrigenium kumadai]|uniref:hypothetical protein n=1 Tax=Ferrigenium kumadai TaxID=1682490 RepID=UPI001BB392A5|nr:hypothetical protein [Ferrigenium kumadai]